MAQSNEELNISIPEFNTWKNNQNKNLKPLEASKRYGGAFGRIGSTGADKFSKLASQTTSFEGTTLIIDGTEIKAKQGLAYSIMDSVNNGSSSNKKEMRSLTTADEVLSSVSENNYNSDFMSGLKSTGEKAGKSFANTGNSILDGYNSLAPKVSGALESGFNSVQGGIDSAGETITNAATATKNVISKYSAPLTKVTSVLGDMMKEFDDWVSTTFIGQIFGIKGSEIVCTVFCIVVSFLSCKTRSKLYSIAMAVKASEAALKQGQQLGIDLTTTYNSDIVGPSSIASATSKLFGNKINTNEALLPKDKVLNIMGAPSQTGKTNIPSTPNWNRSALQAPSEVRNTIEAITKVIKTITKMKVTIPVGINGDIWNLAQAILFALQGVVIQMATELLNNIFKPVEDAIKKIVPDNCLSNLASIFFNKIIDTIKRFKQWLLDQIREFFSASKGFSLKWKTFGLNVNFLLELLGLLNGLSIVLAHWADILIACGLTPCEQEPDGDVFSPDIWKPTGESGTTYPPKSALKSSDPSVKYGGTPSGVDKIGNIMSNSLDKSNSKPGVNSNNNGLDILSTKFADIINQTNRKNVMDALRSGVDIPMSNIPAARLSMADKPKGNHEQIDNIAKKLAPVLKIPMENIVVTPKELSFIQPGFQNAPSKIAKLISDGIVEGNLGPGWTTFVSDDNKNIDVVYTFRRSCGD